MWNLIICLAQGHVFTSIRYGGTPYEYCLRCGKVRGATFGQRAGVTAGAMVESEKMGRMRPNG
jgi:hypothetical protein